MTESRRLSSDEVAYRNLADELYDLHPTEFTAARNAAAKDSPNHDAIMAFVRPSAAAWLVNLLVRQRSAEITAALELGEQLRAAQADLDRETLAELTKQRRALVAALARQGAEIAELQGHRVTPAVVDSVAQTLQAAMADPDASAAVATGRLVRALTTIGLSVDLDGAVAGDAEPRSRATHPIDELEEKRAEKRRREAEAQAALEAAESEHQKAERRVADALRARDAIADEVEAAASTLKQLKRTLAEADRAIESVRSERDKAEAAAETARLGLESH